MGTTLGVVIARKNGFLDGVGRVSSSTCSREEATDAVAFSRIGDSDVNGDRLPNGAELEPDVEDEEPLHRELDSVLLEGGEPVELRPYGVDCGLHVREGVLTDLVRDRDPSETRRIVGDRYRRARKYAASRILHDTPHAGAVGLTIRIRSPRDQNQDHQGERPCHGPLAT